MVCGVLDVAVGNVRVVGVDRNTVGVAGVRRVADVALIALVAIDFGTADGHAIRQDSERAVVVERIVFGAGRRASSGGLVCLPI